jgi:hypothetical protein
MSMTTAAATVKTEEPKSYNDKILACFKHLCDLNPKGASPGEVTGEMRKRGWLSPMDTVIDIVKLMRDLRSEGRL